MKYGIRIVNSEGTRHNEQEHYYKIALFAEDGPWVRNLTGDLTYDRAVQQESAIRFAFEAGLEEARKQALAVVHSVRSTTPDQDTLEYERSGKWPT